MNVLVIGAHPDDLEVGMGGTIAKYSQKGHDVLMIVTTSPNNKDRRHEESIKSAEMLGAQLEFLDILPNELVFSRELVRKYDAVVKDFKPDVIYTHWNHDSHQDHIAVSNAVIASSRKNSCSLYMYEQTIPGGVVPYAFQPQLFVDVTDTIDKKIESVRSHKSQVDANGEWWEYGIKGRAMYRGYQIHKKYAEAFEVVKDIKII
jgi:LmbE family N-acetylglucosaminyl deacetylase